MSILSKSVLAVVVCLSLVVLAGCGGSSNGVSGGATDGDDSCPECPDYSWAAPEGDPVLLSGYSITYMGSYYDALLDQTSFCYLVAGTGVQPTLSYWILGLPSCVAWDDVVAYQPVDGCAFADPDSTTGVRGLKHAAAVSADGSQKYCLTLDGNYAEGTIVVAVKAGQLVETGELTGPACPVE